MSKPSPDVYSPLEIARAAGISEDRVLAYLGARGPVYLPYGAAVDAGLALRRAEMPRTASAEPPFFALFSSPPRARRTAGLPLALSGTLHAGVLAAVVFVATFGLTSSAATITSDETLADPMRLVFIAAPGPGGGGGGGGMRLYATPPTAQREGRRSISSPIPRRNPPPAEAAPLSKVEPRLDAEPLPVIVAPLVTAPGDPRDRAGVLARTNAELDSRGPGDGGGAGSGAGTGLGQGDGGGVGPGSGGGTGGGPFRPGSGIEAPKLLREVKAVYTEDARRQGLAGNVVLEIVVRRDGSVGDVKILQGLGAGLNDRAVEAVRQWRFAPARRQGAEVDVIVEVAVEFRLR